MYRKIMYEKYLSSVNVTIIRSLSSMSHSLRKWHHIILNNLTEGGVIQLNNIKFKGFIL